MTSVPVNIEGKQRQQRHLQQHHEGVPTRKRKKRHKKSCSIDKRFDAFDTIEQVKEYSADLDLSVMSEASTSRGTSSVSRLEGHLSHPPLRRSYHLVPHPIIINTSTPTTSENANITTNQPDSNSTTGGALSVRRLISLVRSTSSQNGPVYSRRILFRNFVTLCIGHGLITAAFVPLFSLQSSMSSWWWPQENNSLNSFLFYSNMDIGSLLLASFFALGAVSSLFMPVVVKVIGTKWTLLFCYTGCCLFFGFHIYPKIYILIPGYMIMGICDGLMAGTKTTALISIANKFAFVLSEEEERELEDTVHLGRKEIVIHKLSRRLQSTHDFGLIMGNIVTAIFLLFTNESPQEIKNAELALKYMFDINSERERICGSLACPTEFPSERPVTYGSNSTSDATVPLVLPCKTSTLLACVFLGSCVIAFLFTAVCMRRLRLRGFHDDPNRNILGEILTRIRKTFSDTKLQLAAPLALFIGLEQTFMFADFTKSYVVCALGIHYVSTVFISLGVLQCLSAFTLSLMLQHVSRCVAVFAGFLFHSCLILVLILWKPSIDDLALFYVISAAWGVCNSIWESVLFSFLTSVYTKSWSTAIGHNYFFRFMGVSLAFALHGAVCNIVKLYGLAATLVLGVLSFLFLENYVYRKKRQNRDQVIVMR